MSTSSSELDIEGHRNTMDDEHNDNAAGGLFGSGSEDDGSENDDY